MSWFLITQSTTGKQIVIPEVQEILDVKGTYVTCKKNEKWGLMDIENGKISWKIEPIYQDAGSFSEELLPCSKDGEKWGYVDSKNHVVIPFIWDYAFPFSEGLAIISQNGVWGVINKQGEYLIQPSASILRSYSNNVAVGCIKNHWFVINKQAKSIITPQVDFLGSFYHNQAAINHGGVLYHPQVVVGGKWGFINKQGLIVIQPQYDWVGNFQHLYAPFYKQEEDIWGFLSLNGMERHIESIDGIREYSYGLASVEKNGYWGFINIQGKTIIPAVYDEVKPYHPDYCFVKKED